MTDAHEAEFDQRFETACSTIDPGDSVVRDRELAVWGRPVRVPLSTSHVAQFTFDDLCGEPHSAADYLEITKTFGTIFLRGVPQLGLDTKDQARRFILFIDAAYEARVSRSCFLACLGPAIGGYSIPSARTDFGWCGLPTPPDQAVCPLGSAHSVRLFGRAQVDRRDHASHARHDGRPRPFGRDGRLVLDLYWRRGGVCVRSRRGASPLRRAADPAVPFPY